MSSRSTAVTTMEIFAGNVMQLIESKGLSVTWLARETGLSRPGLSAMLNLRHGNCTFETAEKIAAALETPLLSLLKPE